jgi:glucans biosynthesis protein
MLIDFAGEDLHSLRASQPVRAVVSGLGARVFDVTTQRLPENGHWRVRFKVQPTGGRPVDLRCYLELYGAPLSETWTYQWTPGS